MMQILTVVHEMKYDGSWCWAWSTDSCDDRFKSYEFAVEESLRNEIHLGGAEASLMPA